MDKEDKLTEEDKLAVIDKLAEKIKKDEESRLTVKMKQIEEAKLNEKAKLKNETPEDKIRRYAIGPFQFLALSLIVSESMLAYWMIKLFDFTSSNSTDYYERIVVGSLSIAILIAVLVVFYVVYKIKKHRGDCDH